MQKHIILPAIITILLLSTIPLCYGAYTGLDTDDDVPDLTISTGNSTADAIVNFILGTMSNFIEILYDAFLKVPFSVLANSWLVVYNSLLGWGLGSPTAWAIATLLFIITLGIGISLFFKIIDILA